MICQVISDKFEDKDKAITIYQREIKSLQLEIMHLKYNGINKIVNIDLTLPDVMGVKATLIAQEDYSLNEYQKYLLRYFIQDGINRISLEEWKE